LFYSVSATLTFEASHVLDGHVECRRLHGHTWTVTAHTTHEEMDAGYPRGGSAIRWELAKLVGELAFRDLNQMLPDFSPTPPAIAAWFFERLAHGFPGLTRVEVCNPIECGLVSKV